MADGVSTQALTDFRRTFEAYIRENSRENGPLLEARGTRLRFAIYRAFRAIMPARDAIEAEAAALGYAIKRRSGPDGKPVSVRREIALRTQSRGFLAASFIFRGWKRKPDGQTRKFSARSKKGTTLGFADVRTSKGNRNPSIEIGSLLEGAVKQNANRGIMEKALREEVADMIVYIRRKVEQRKRKHLRPNYA